MKLQHLDHLVLTVADIPATLRFYTEILGMKAVTFGQDRYALTFGKQKINLHQKGKELEPKAAYPTCGSADLCFITNIPVEQVKTELESKGIKILEGVVDKTGATGAIRSIYFQDPDGNLLEVSNYKKTDFEIDKLAYLEIQDGKILSTRSKGKDKYYIPGGKRDPRENDVEALIREVFEELSVKIHPETIKYIGTFKAQADRHVDGVIVKMTCYSAKYEGTLSPDSEIEEIRWLNYKDIDLVSHVDKVIFNFLKNQGTLK